MCRLYSVGVKGGRLSPDGSQVQLDSNHRKECFLGLDLMGEKSDCRQYDNGQAENKVDRGEHCELFNRIK